MAALSIQRLFLAYRSILEKCLLEEMCLELKISLKIGLKNVLEAFLLVIQNSHNFCTRTRTRTVSLFFECF